jgi:hypothetical protein
MNFQGHGDLLYTPHVSRISEVAVTDKVSSTYIVMISKRHMDSMANRQMQPGWLISARAITRHAKQHMVNL